MANTAQLPAIRVETPLTLADAIRKDTAAWLHAFHDCWEKRHAGNEKEIRHLDCLSISYEPGGPHLEACAVSHALMVLPPFTPDQYAFAFFKRRGYPLYTFALFRRRPGRDWDNREQMDFFARLGEGVSRLNAVRDFERRLAGLLKDFPKWEDAQ